jgi:hypothetical protein
MISMGRRWFHTAARDPKLKPLYYGLDERVECTLLLKWKQLQINNIVNLPGTLLYMLWFCEILQTIARLCSMIQGWLKPLILPLRLLYSLMSDVPLVWCFSDCGFLFNCGDHRQNIEEKGLKLYTPIGLNKDVRCYYLQLIYRDRHPKVFFEQGMNYLSVG